MFFSTLDNPYGDSEQNCISSEEDGRESLRVKLPAIDPAEAEAESGGEGSAAAERPVASASPVHTAASAPVSRPAVSSTGRIPRVSALGPSHTPHRAAVGESAAEREEGERELFREPVHTVAADTAPTSDVRWPGSKPPTVDPYGPRPKRDRRHVGAMAAVAVVLVAAVVGIGTFAYFNPLPVEVQVNGITVSIAPNATAEKLEEAAIAAGMEAPSAGNHLALDGSVIQKGGGSPYTVTVDGAQAGDGPLGLKAGAQVAFENGADTTEDFTEEQLPAEPGVVRTGTGAIHAYVAGTPGKLNRKTGTESGISVDEVVEAPVDGQLKCYNADTGGDKVIALTFDDGPWANPDTTRQILDVLEANDAKATFFTVGNCIKNAPDQVKRAFDAGCEILTHSRDHAKGDGNGVDLTRMTPEDQIAEITDGYDAIQEVTGTAPATIIRAPGGNFDGDILKTLAPYVTYEIGWNIDTTDWERPGADKVEAAIMKAGAGDIVLMHDGGGDRSQTVEALAKALPKLKEEGYRFITISELLAYNNPADM